MQFRYNQGLQRTGFPARRASKSAAEPKRYAGEGMRYKVELGFIDPSDDKKNVFYSTYVEANGIEKAVEIAKKIQSAERPDLTPGSRWLWVAYETYEDI